MHNSSLSLHRKTEYCWWPGERCRGKGYCRNSCSKKCDYWRAGLERTTCVFLSADQLFGQCHQVSNLWVNYSWPLDTGLGCLILLNLCNFRYLESCNVPGTAKRKCEPSTSVASLSSGVHEPKAADNSIQPLGGNSTSQLSHSWVLLADSWIILCRIMTNVS